MYRPRLLPTVYLASDELEYADWLTELEAAADSLGLDSTARSRARDLFLTAVPEEDRSKRPAIATAIYVGALVAGEERSQGTVAETVGVSRLSIQQRWKAYLDEAGLDAPDW